MKFSHSRPQQDDGRAADPEALEVYFPCSGQLPRMAAFLPLAAQRPADSTKTCTRPHKTLLRRLLGPDYMPQPPHFATGIAKPYPGACSGQAWRRGSRPSCAQFCCSRVISNSASSRRSSSSSTCIWQAKSWSACDGMRIVQCAVIRSRGASSYASSRRLFRQIQQQSAVPTLGLARAREARPASDSPAAAARASQVSKCGEAILQHCSLTPLELIGPWKGIYQAAESLTRIKRMTDAV